MDGLTQIKLLRERCPSPTELRVIQKKGPPLAGLYDDLKLLSQDALAQNKHGACYINLNPVKLDRKVTNQLAIARSGQQVGNADIVRRTALLIDIDPNRPKNEASTDAELQAAVDCANRVLAFLTEQGWPAPLILLSGNGMALIFGIDLPTDDGGLVVGVLEALSRRFSNTQVKIDTSVNDPARITRLAGTVNRKGNGEGDRPHRWSKIIKAPEKLETVPCELLEELAKPAVFTSPEESLSDFKVSEWLAGLEIKFTEKNGKCGDVEGTWYTLPHCPNKPHLDTDGNTGIFQSDDGLTIRVKCHHAKCADLTWKTLRSQLDKGFDSRADQAALGGTDEAVRDPHRLARIVMGQFQHPEFRTIILVQGTIYTWAKGVWTAREKDEMKLVIAREMKKEFDRYAAAMRRQGAPITTPQVTNKLVNDTHLALASMIEVSAQSGDWLSGDGPSANHRIACRNGILDLKAYFRGEFGLLSHTPRLFVTSLLNIDFQTEANPPERWLKLLDEIWPGDMASQELLQDFFGYCLTGSCEFQKFLLMVGCAGGGKGTITRALESLIGSENTCSIFLSNLGQRFTLEQAIGKSVVFLPDATTPLLEKQPAVLEVLKSVVGGDTVSVDRKHIKAVSLFLPLKFVISSNELLELRENSSALERRMLVLRFIKSFEKNPDPFLDEKLRKELAGIFSWSLEGLKRLRERGHFLEPESSQSLKAELRKKGSPITEFLEECCILGIDEMVLKDDLFHVWKEWCQQNDHMSGNKGQLTKDLFAVSPLITAGKTPVNGKRVPCYRGVALLIEEPEFEEPQVSHPMTVPLTRDSLASLAS